MSGAAENYMSQNPDENPPKPKKKKSCFSRLALFTLIVFGIWWFNNCTIKITRENLYSSKLENSVTIAVISDYHASESAFALENDYVIKKINKCSPDIICILGDMHSYGALESEKEKSFNLMTELVATGRPVFFVLGEHDDRTNAYVRKMENSGIRVLDSQKATVTIGKSKINIYGISNAFFSPSFDLTNEFKIDKDEYNILLAHIPMYEHYEKFGADLTLCGDTHGGIVRLPLLGPIYGDNSFLPFLTKDKNEVYDKGLFEYEGGYMFITSGLGNYILEKSIPVRFCNRPEVAVIEISPE